MHRYLEGAATRRFTPSQRQSGAWCSGHPTRPGSLAPRFAWTLHEVLLSVKITCLPKHTSPGQPFPRCHGPRSDASSLNVQMRLLLRKFVLLTFLLLCLGSGSLAFCAWNKEMGRKGVSERGILRGEGASQRGGRKRGEREGRAFWSCQVQGQSQLWLLHSILGKLIAVTRLVWVQAISCVYKTFFHASAFLQLFLLQSPSLPKNKSRSKSNFLPNCPERIVQHGWWSTPEIFAVHL